MHVSKIIQEDIAVVKLSEAILMQVLKVPTLDEKCKLELLKLAKIESKHDVGDSKGEGHEALNSIVPEIIEGVLSSIGSRRAKVKLEVELL